MHCLRGRNFVFLGLANRSIHPLVRCPNARVIQTPKF